MKQLTLVAYFGPKPPYLASLIESLQAAVERTALGVYFTPYPTDQMHGTIIGLEKAEGVSKNYNANFLRATGEEKVMDFSCLLQTLETCLPMSVRVGGFAERYDGFQSFGDLPFRRSFGIHWASGRVVLVGWPYTEAFHSFDFRGQRLLWQLRENLNDRCHIRHKYHEQEDNDLYLVLGTLNLPDGLEEAHLEELKRRGRQLEKRFRSYLYHNPISLNLDMDTLFVVRYQQPSLELPGSRAWTIREIREKGIAIERLYE